MNKEDMTNKRILFITTNKHKFNEVNNLLKEYPIELEQKDLDYEENHDESIEEIAENAASKLANKLKQSIVLEDTGLFFEAYDGFPGALPKFVFNTLKYKGFFKLLEGESRSAYFKTVAAFCEPGKDPKIFDGVMQGKIADKVYNENEDSMPYDRIFIPEGKDKTVSDMSMDEKNSISQRAQAFRKFGEYMKSKLAEDK